MEPHRPGSRRCAGLDSWQRARLLALVDMAMADGFIAGFRAKYDFNFWRPVTAIRAGDTDGNDDTVADLSWSTLLNTPAIPDYPVDAQRARRRGCRSAAPLLRDDDVAFMTTSGAPFAGITRSYDSFSEAARENGESRVYAGSISERRSKTASSRAGRSAGTCSRTL